MEAVAKLINEFGRLPKENMCVQEVGLSDAQSVTFLQNCVMFFEIFIDVSNSEIKFVCSSAGPQII